MTDSQTVEAYTQTLSNNGFVCPQSATICHQVSANLLPALGMLDRHSAIFYNVKPIRLREQVKRNAERFPSDFMLQLTEDEVDSMVSQSAIPSRQHLGGSLPFAFTEQGVAALAAVLRSERAVEVSIHIARAFVAMRRVMLSMAPIIERLKSLEFKQLQSDEKFSQIFKALEQQSENLSTQGIFFDGQIFDAYSFASKIISSAKKEILLIDNYIDDSVLTLLSKRQASVRATIYTRKISKTFQLDLEKHNAQYPPITVKTLARFHDRFIIIDEKALYHLGASLKDLGKQCFAFSRMDGLLSSILGKLK